MKGEQATMAIEKKRTKMVNAVTAPIAKPPADHRLLLSLNDSAAALPLKEITYLDNTTPRPKFAKANTEKLAAEHPEFQSVPGWLIIGACIFQKHWAVRDGSGRLVEITPEADLLPFSAHYPLIGSFDTMPDEISLLQPNEPALNRRINGSKSKRRSARL